MVDRRDVELLIRAKDLSTKPLRDVAKAIDGISDSLEQQVAAAQKGELSYQELAASLKQVQEAGKALAGAASGIQRFQALGDQSAKLADRVRATSVALREFRDGLGSAGATTTKQQRELRSLESAYASAQKAFEKNQATMATASAALEEAGVDTRNLAAAQQQIVTSATAAGQSATVLSTAMAGYARNAREAAAASRELRDTARFQKLADDANEAVRASQRLATTTGAVQPMRTDTSSSIRQLIDPAAQARTTLAGLEEQIRDTAGAVAAINGPFKGYEQTLGQVAAAQRQKRLEKEAKVAADALAEIDLNTGGAVALLDHRESLKADADKEVAEADRAAADALLALGLARDEVFTDRIVDLAAEVKVLLCERAATRIAVQRLTGRRIVRRPEELHVHRPYNCGTAEGASLVGAVRQVLGDEWAWRDPEAPPPNPFAFV